MEARKSHVEITTSLQNWCDHLHDELRKKGWQVDVVREAAINILQILDEEEIIDLMQDIDLEGIPGG